MSAKWQTAKGARFVVKSIDSAGTFGSITNAISVKVIGTGSAGSTVYEVSGPGLPGGVTVRMSTNDIASGIASAFILQPTETMYPTVTQNILGAWSSDMQNLGRDLGIVIGNIAHERATKGRE